MGIWQRKQKRYKMLKFYDTDLWGDLLAPLRKRFREHNLWVVRQSKRFTWRLSSKINPSKLRRRKRSWRSTKFLQKQLFKQFFKVWREKQVRRFVARVKAEKRNNYLTPLSVLFARRIEQRQDTLLLRLGFTHKVDVPLFLARKRFLVNGGAFRSGAKLVRVGDVLKFPTVLPLNVLARKQFLNFYPRSLGYLRFARRGSLFRRAKKFVFRKGPFKFIAQRFRKSFKVPLVNFFLKRLKKVAPRQRQIPLNLLHSLQRNKLSFMFRLFKVRHLAIKKRKKIF